MSKSRVEYGHVTFPLSLTEQEKEQYASFCKLNNQTMSGRIKELMRKDMGMSVLSPFKEGYQLSVINTIRDNKNVIITKSRQMWISTILLSVALENMLTHEGGVKPYSCMFICCNNSVANHHIRKFLELCSQNGLKVQEGRLAPNEIYLSNGAYIRFVSKVPQGVSANIAIFDEFAFNNSTTEEEISMLQACGCKVILSSTPNRGSLFNEIAKGSLLGKNQYAHVFAHWKMNSVHQANAEVEVSATKDGPITCDIVHKTTRSSFNDARYGEEMDCTIL